MHVSISLQVVLRPAIKPAPHLNDHRTKRIVVDRERALLVRQVFDQYASGDVTLDNLRHFLAENGVRTKNGKLVGRTFVFDMLTNPIHYGHFCYAGGVYEGKHEAIISKDLFDGTQAVLFGRWTEVLGSERLTGVLLDRLTHRVHILEADGQSYRLADAKRRLKKSKSPGV